jgi:DNA-binding NarL/FixJ family response regulator
MIAEVEQPVRVVLADDQRLVRESLATLLGLLAGIELLAIASDGVEALALVAEHSPDVVLMDLRMPRMDGIEATRHLRERHPDVRVIALTTFADDESVLGALRAGARGYLTKDASSEDIHTAIHTVAAGDAALDPPYSTTSWPRSRVAARLATTAAWPHRQSCPTTSRHARQGSSR